METILFESYQKYQQEHKENLFRAIFKLPATAIILLVAIISSAILGICAIFIKAINFMAPYAIANEAFMCVVIYFYTDRFRIKTCDKRLSQYATYCFQLADWLKSTGFVFTSENVEQLIARVSAKLDKIEGERLKRKEAVEKWIQILIIPVLLAVFSQAIRQQEDVTVLLAFAVEILAIIGLFGLSVLSVYSVIEFFNKRRIEQLRGFLDDLQGVLDTQFEEGMFRIENK